jgi:hypothetical protein
MLVSTSVSQKAHHAKSLFVQIGIALVIEENIFCVLSAI